MPTDGIMPECLPILSNDELLAFMDTPNTWEGLVEPLSGRCPAQKLGKDFRYIRNYVPVSIGNEATRPKVLVCHDFAGNYGEDRFINGSSKWDDYRFYHWAGIDYFCYFSHSYITIPPLPWINAAHRNGVPILGTVIVENDDGESLLKQVLESEKYMLRIVDSLVNLTERFCIDGWLINIESQVDSQKVPLLLEFVKQFTERIHKTNPKGEVFWYDSVIKSGDVSCQNELNELNIDFFNVSDGILLNYNWDRAHLERSAQILSNDPALMSKVFVGIDVFSKSQMAKYESCQTLRKIKDFNFSTCIFAPSWTYEHTLEVGLNPMATYKDKNVALFHNFLVNDHLFWTLLWEYLYTSGPKTLPFYTSFCLGSGKMKCNDGIQSEKKPWFNIMEQDYQPSVLSVHKYYFGDAFRGGCCLEFRENVNGLRLFVSDFDCDQDIVVSYAYTFSVPHIRVDLILKIINSNGENLIVHCGNYGEAKSTSGQKIIPPIIEGDLGGVAHALGQRKEKILPTDRSEYSDWAARFYYLKFNLNVKSSRIVDVGISIAKDGEWTDDFLRLGAVHIQAGILDDKEIVISKDSQIDSQDFIQ